MSVMFKAASVLVLAGICANAYGQSCGGQWLPGYGVPGVNGTVKASTLWDPDGPGPAPEVLVIGGSFTMVDKTPANNLAMWDGNHWSEIGGGTNGSVNVLATFQGKLYASGAFTQAGGNPSDVLAAWDGTTWTGTGIEPTSVNALLVYQNALVVAGNLKINGAGATIAKWNGTAWSFLGVNSSIGSAIYALAEYQGKLIAGGSFSSAGGNAAGGVASWDGAWTALGSGVPTTKYVKSLLVYGQYLFAGGNFTTIGGVTSPYLARWTGAQWEQSGAPYTTLFSTSEVNTLAQFDGKLVAGGNTFPERTYSWDGTNWSQFGRKIYQSVYCLQPYGDLLFAGFDGISASPLGRGLTVYRDGDWRPTAEGFSGAFQSAAPFGGELVLGGGLSLVPGSDAVNVASWNGAAWKSMKGETIDPVTSVRVQNEILYVGTTNVNQYSTFNYVGQWNGSNWVPLAQQLNLNGFDNNATTLGEYDGKLLALGGFVSAGPTTLGHIGLWDGAQWQPIGTGPNGVGDSAAVYQNELVVAGSQIVAPPGPVTTRVLKFDGSAWRVLIPNLQSSAQERLLLLNFGNKLVVAGSGLKVGSFAYGAIGAWNGTSFSSLDGTAQSAMNGTVRSLNEYHGTLVAAGSFAQAGPVPAANIARWNGTAWTPMGSGLNGSVSAATVWNDELIASGLFTTASGQPSAYFARWTDNPTPWVAVSPESRPVNKGLTLTLSAAAASGYANVSYQWKRNGADISNGAGGASAGGGTVSGASGVLASPSDGSSVTMTIAGVQASDAGDYTIEFDNTCNAATSTIAAVTVNTCLGDLNADGFVNDADFEIFVQAYNILLCEEAAMPIGCLSDLNGDGVVDDADFQIFVPAYDALVCE